MVSSHVLIMYFVHIYSLKCHSKYLKTFLVSSGGTSINVTLKPLDLQVHVSQLARIIYKKKNL